MQPDPDSTTLFPASIDGLDVAAGIRRMEGDPALYLSILRDFLATERDVADVIAQAVASGDGPTATRRAHTVKGLAGTIGALRLQATALALESALRESRPADELDAALAHFRTTLDALCAALDAGLPPETEPEPHPTGPVDLDQIADICRELLPLLIECDIAASRHFEHHRSLLKAAFGEALTPIDRAIHNFDYEIAESGIIELCRQRGLPDPTP